MSYVMRSIQVIIRTFHFESLHALLGGRTVAERSLPAGLAIARELVDAVFTVTVAARVRTALVNVHCKQRKKSL